MAKVAKIVSEHLVEADLCGVDSHGVIRIPEYTRRIIGTIDEIHQIIPDAEATIVREKGCVAEVDGGWGFGQPAAYKAMELAIRKAKEYGVGAVGAINCAHVGRLGAYSSMATERDAIGIVTVKAFPIMAAYGGASRVLGNNPYSFAMPAGEELPIVIDFATSVAARGKLLVKKALGEKIPKGWIVDKEGRASVNPQDFFDGGSVLPFGEHKGYGLAVAAEVLAGSLLGIGRGSGYKGHNSVMMIAIDVESFIPLNVFKKSVDELVRTIKTSRIAEGFKEILLPGEPEAREKEERLKEGIPVDDEVMRQIRWAAGQFGVSL